MKKITNLFVVLSILAATVFMTGCGLKEAIDSTHNKWYKYTGGDGVIDVPCGDDTTADSTTAGTLKNTELYLYYDDDDGLLVVLQKDSVQSVDLVGGLLTEDITITSGAKKQYTKADFGPVKWGIAVGSGAITPCETPKFIADHDHCVDLSEALANGIQWKKFLRDILINQLFPEE